MVIRRAAFLVLTGAAGAAALKTYKDKVWVLLQLPFEKKIRNQRQRDIVKNNVLHDKVNLSISTSTSEANNLGLEPLHLLLQPDHPLILGVTRFR